MARSPTYGYTQDPYLGGRADAGIWRVCGRHRYVSSRLTLNLGLRYDYSKGYFNSFPTLDRNANEIGTSPAVDKLFDWSVISPRLGAIVKLNEAGTTLIKGSWGRYYRGIVTGEFDDATPSISPRYVFSGLYDAARQSAGTWILSATTPSLRSTPGFENPYTDQFILTVEHQFSDRLGHQCQRRLQEERQPVQLE